MVSIQPLLSLTHGPDAQRLLVGCGGGVGGVDIKLSQNVIVGEKG